MKRLVLLIALISLSEITFSQQANFNFAFDHQAIMVSDLNKSADFYANILGLKEIDNKTNNTQRRWFSLGEGISIHLIAGDNSNVSLNKTIHLALKTTNFNAFVENLKKNDIDFWDWEGSKGKIAIRNDGAKQVYILDPDGYWIEINNDI